MTLNVPLSYVAPQIKVFDLTQNPLFGGGRVRVKISVNYFMYRTSYNTQQHMQARVR